MAKAIDLSVLRTLSNKHGRVYPAGSTIFAEGDTSGEFYVILQGKVEIAKEVSGQGGASPQQTLIATIGSGDILGEMAAFTGEPRSASAFAVEDTSVLFFDQQTTIALLRVSPQFGLDIIRALADRLRVNNERITALERQLQGATPATRPSQPSGPGAGATRAEFNEGSFLAKSVECPVCHTSFNVLSVRSQALRPGTEDSDFHRQYHGVSPFHYAIYVCPDCYYAAYPDDFGTVTPEEIERLTATKMKRIAAGNEFDFHGERALPAVNRSFDLAEQSYAPRQMKDPRRARLCHERAWIARELGDAVLEREYLGKAMTAYIATLEGDKSLSGFQQVRVIYLIGEIALRLGREQDALKWFGNAMQHEHFKKQPALVKLVTFRRDVARDQMVKKGHA